MATSSTLAALPSQPLKRKQATYGKPARRDFKAVGEQFDAIEEHPHASPPPQRNHLRTPTKASSAKRHFTEKVDSGVGEFDVPSSDDEPNGQRITGQFRGRLATPDKGVRAKAPVSLIPEATSSGAGLLHPNKRRRILGNVEHERSRRPPKQDAPSYALGYRSRTPLCGVSEEDDVDQPTQVEVVSGMEPLRRQSKKSRGQLKNSSPKKVAPRQRPTARIIAAKDALKPPARGATRLHSSERSEVSARTTRTARSRSTRSASQGEKGELSGVNRASPMPRDVPSTPPMQIESDLENLQRAAVATPRQAKLWTDLLSDREGIAATPNIRFNTLSLAARNENHTIPENEALTTDMPRPAKLVDLLRMSAPDSASSDGIEPEDITMNDTTLTSPIDNSSAQASATDMVDDPASQSIQVMVTGPKFTYGGQRSYLQDSQSLEDLLTEPLETELIPLPAVLDTAVSSKRPTATKRDVFDVSDDEEDTKAVKSIHELRAAGNSGNITHEISALVDELSNSSHTAPTRKRTAILDLCKKLTNPTFRLRFIQGGHENQVFRPLCDTEDVVIIFTVASAIILLLTGQTEVANPQRLYDAAVVPLLVKSLGGDHSLMEIVKDRQAKMSKVAQTHVIEVQRTILKLPHWQFADVPHLSPRLLSLRALELLVRNLREHGIMTEAVLDKSMLEGLQSVMTNATSNLNERSSKVAIFQLETALSIVESCTLAPTCVADKTLWNPESLRQLVKSLDATLRLSAANDRTIDLLVLRLTVNLSNGNVSNAEGLAEGPFVLQILSRISRGLEKQQDGASQLPHLDNLLLALGALINLAECSHAVRSIVLTEGLDYIDALVDAFVVNSKKASEADSLEASEANVAYGYLAILFGSFCLNPDVKQHVASRLPGKRLDPIITALEEFIVHHQEADKRVENNEAYTLFTEKLRTVANTLKALDA